MSEVFVESSNVSVESSSVLVDSVTITTDTITSVPVDQNYQLIIKMPFSVLDDVVARQKATEILEKLQLPNERIVKLQRLQVNKEPMGVKL